MTPLFPNFTLSDNGDISSAFLSRGLTTFLDAANFIRGLRFKRNENTANKLCVLENEMGTCSSKHVLLGRLAQEQKAPIELMLGVYEMNGENTSGVGHVLHKRGLTAVPEAHCYLRADSQRWDFTRTDNSLTVKLHFLFGIALSPDEVVARKVVIHRDYIARWVNLPGKSKLNLDEVWSIREECIAALAEGGG